MVSSACVCHTDEYCFYCEMYVKLESKKNEMREAIEKVIAELEASKAYLRPDVSQHMRVCDAYYDMGMRAGYNDAIRWLKEVLADADSNTDSANGHGKDDRRDGQTDQVVSSER